MAIGTLTAIGLGLGAVGAIGSSSAQKKAANTAAQTAQNTTDANNALARDIYGQNQQALAPFMQRGNVAGGYLNAMLGLPSGAPSNTAATYSMGGGQSFPTRQAVQEMQFGNDYGIKPSVFNKTRGYGQYAPLPQGGVQQQQGYAPQNGVSMNDAQGAFGNYIKNSDYGFQFATGANQVNSGYAGNGTVKSGAAMKALEDYRQNLQSGYRGEYMNALGNQQGVGLSGANALAGVSTNFGNTIAANNNAAGTAAANAALAKGNNSFGNVLGMIGGGLYGYGRR